MTKIFTKSDIEFEHFEEEVSYLPYSDNQQVSRLYEHLEELKSQDIYVVDVALVSTHAKISSLSEVFNQYMIRFVRPKYEVILTSCFYNKLSDKFEWAGDKSLGYFRSSDEIEQIKRQYLTKNSDDEKFSIETRYYSPLDQEL